MGLAHSNIAPTAHGAACQTCNRTHGTSIVAEGSESQIRQFLSQIQGLDQSRVQNATTKCALVDILHDAHTQCLRVWGTARLPKSCSPAFISEVKRLRKEDPEKADQMIQEKRNGQPMASRMVQDAERCLGVLEQDGESGYAWLKELKPDWSDSVSLLRSVYTTRTNVPAMTRLSALTGSSTHSFCILVSIMRAIKFNDWTAACKMWAFERAPDGGHPIVGGTPEMLLECEPAQLDNLLQSNDVSNLEEDHCDDCAVCLCPMVTGVHEETEVWTQLPQRLRRKLDRPAVEASAPIRHSDRCKQHDGCCAVPTVQARHWTCWWTRH